MAENREVDKKIQTNAETINKVPYDDYSDFGVEEIRELLGKGHYTRLREVIKDLNDADIADYM